MPYKHTDSLIPRVKGRDKRVKLSAIERESIRLNVSGLSLNALARQYGVSKRLVSFIISPEKHKANLLKRHERGGSSRYYCKDKHRESMKNHRKHKQALYLKGELERKNND